MICLSSLNFGETCQRKNSTKEFRACYDKGVKIVANKQPMIFNTLPLFVRDELMNHLFKSWNMLSTQVLNDLLGLCVFAPALFATTTLKNIMKTIALGLSV